MHFVLVYHIHISATTSPRGGLLSIILSIAGVLGGFDPDPFGSGAILLSP